MHSLNAFNFLYAADLFDMTECPVRAVHFWDDPPPSLQQTLTIPFSVQAPFFPPIDTPSLPGRESIRGAEGDPHFRLLDHIQVLTRNSNDSASTAEASRGSDFMLH